MNRREFLGWVSVGAVASSLPVAIATFLPDSNNSANAETPLTNTLFTIAQASSFKSVGTVAALDKDGQILNKKSPVGSVLVIRNPNDSNSLIAVNPTCPHEGCTVKWKKSEKLFDCPCHDAEFATDGKVLKGPAKKPLATYQAKIEGNSVVVKVS
ncbi:MAG: ubiquinol-cytochrome c reductase iron-sulfur subunit [Phormidium sp.]